MTTRWNDRGLLVLRAAIGIVFVMHGWQKLAVFGHDGVTAFLTQAGVPFPSVNAVLITAAELGGGLAMLAGVATRFSALVLAFSMAVAIVTVHLPNGFFLPNGMEFALTMLLTNLAVAQTGAGAYSIDAWLSARRTGAGQAALRRAA
jgi:putative oxidoreductase